MRCKFNCFECPYPDCISHTESEATPKKKRGRKPLPPEERARRRREYSHRYYEEHKEKMLAYFKEYNRKNVDTLRVKQRAYRDSKGAKQGRPITIWVTNGTKNKRTLLSELPKYEAMGWYRGRTDIRRNTNGILG